MTKKIIETPVVLTELQEPIAVTEDGVELAKVIDATTTIKPVFPTRKSNAMKDPFKESMLEIIHTYTTDVKALIVRLNELEARLDYNDRRIAVLMQDREASIRLLHGRMNNEVGLQAMINGWENV